ncbi:MAG: radical SAM protein [Deltaproteobacteria bacterium]|nr:radical SAM protein [Deltaproteobacteria bacterium]
MKVILISSNTERINITPLPLGLGCVASATRRAGHRVRMIDLMAEGDNRLVIEKAVESFQPDVIGVSARNIDDQNMEHPRFLLSEIKRVVDECRRLSKATIVLGGAGYSIYPERALEYLGADMGIQGEGEAVFPILLERLQRKSDLRGTPGLYLRRLGLQGEREYEKNLDTFPLPDVPAPPLSTPAGEIWVPVQTSRGCPMNCSYCSTPTIEGRAIRKRSPEMAVEEISRHVEAGFKHFYFVDNVFNLPPSHAGALCKKITERGLRISWRCILYPGKVDRELADLMAEAGCVEASLGFESGCERVLRGMNKRFNSEAVRRASAMLRASGISCMGFLLLGGPGETKESVEESFTFADSLPLDALKITVGIRIYPYTQLAKISVQDGLVSPGDDLLMPRFYIVRDIRDWLYETVRKRAAARPHWLIDSE